MSAQDANTWWDENEQGRGPQPRPKLSPEAEANMWRRAFEQLACAITEETPIATDLDAVDRVVKVCKARMKQLRADEAFVGRVRNAVEARERSR